MNNKEKRNFMKQEVYKRQVDWWPFLINPMFSNFVYICLKVPVSANVIEIYCLFYIINVQKQNKKKKNGSI